MAKYSLETKIKVLAADPEAVNAINAIAPGIIDNPMVKKLPYTLPEIVKFTKGQLNDEVLAKIETALLEL